MRRLRRRREQLSVSLFPFLAVLICTLGVLILMLVMAAKNADLEAREVREEDQKNQELVLERISQLEIELNTRQVQVEGLSLVRPEATKRLSHIRNYRGRLEEEIRNLDREASQLAQQLLQLDAEIKNPIEAMVSDEDLESLESQVEQARDKLNEVRNASAEFEPVAYSIVTEPGPGGTRRRPIYLECNEQGVVLQPSGVVLTESDFLDPLIAGNPLDASLLVIREYWNRYDLAGTEGNPYPLLVIRPSGANSYVVARRAMKSWDDEFGYEIVEEDTNLDFGKVDPQLKTEIENAIAEAKRRQSRVVAASIEQRSRLRGSLNEATQQRPGLVASGQLGGFVSTGNSQSGEPSQGISDQSEQSSGFGNDSEPVFDSVLDQYRDNRQAKSSQSKSLPQATDGVPMNNAQASANLGGGNQAGNFKFSKPGESLANERGQGWALPSKAPGATGYLRPVRVFCANDQLAVRTATDNLVVIPMKGSTTAAVEELIDVVWKMIDGWGSAGDNGFWKPELRISILPTGRQRFDELKMLLHQSGLEIRESNE